MSSAELGNLSPEMMWILAGFGNGFAAEPSSPPAQIMRPMTKDKLVEWAIANGWTKDRYGNLLKANGGVHRLKLQEYSVRWEYRPKGSRMWTKLRSGYYKNVSINEDGQLSGLR